MVVIYPWWASESKKGGVLIIKDPDELQTSILASTNLCVMPTVQARRKDETLISSPRAISGARTIDQLPASMVAHNWPRYVAAAITKGRTDSLHQLVAVLAPARA